MAKTDTIYLHLRKNMYNGLDVMKMAKSKDAQIRPGDVLVKVKVSVSDTFFEDAVPFIAMEILSLIHI